VKIHCSVLAEDAIKAAISDWKKRHGEPERDECQPNEAKSAASNQ
jgi:nitrogen fixation NifU-like protein